MQNNIILIDTINHLAISIQYRADATINEAGRQTQCRTDICAIHHVIESDFCQTSYNSWPDQAIALQFVAFVSATDNVAFIVQVKNQSV